VSALWFRKEGHWMPRSKNSKQVVKRKTAAPPKNKQSAEIDSAEFDAWAEKQKRKSGCSICRNEVVNATLCALLRSMAKKRAYKVTIQELRRMVEKKHSDTDIGHRALERHLRVCEREIYDRARGRFNGR
jgi:hypothetical protein